MFRCRNCEQFDRKEADCDLYGCMNPATPACRAFTPRRNEDRMHSSLTVQKNYRVNKEIPDDDSD